MKRTLRGLIALTCLSLLGYLFVCTSFPFYPDQTKCMSDEDCLIKTHWQQMGGFEKCAPGEERLGCWSTALAQIMYYHKLRPLGRASYTSRQGHVIDQDLGSDQFDLDRFEETIDPDTPAEVVEQMAKYNYFAAIAVQKDFGSDRYMNKLASSQLFEKHYKVKSERYIAWNNFGPCTLGKLEKVIYNEINAKRPVFLHFANLKDFGHSVVVDGYCYADGVFRVHINQGQGGPDDGWYDFYRGILKSDDHALRVVYTFRPE